MVVPQPIDDVPVFVIKREGAKYRKSRTLHRNLLLPFMCVTDDVRNIEDDEHSDASVSVTVVVVVVVVDDDDETVIPRAEGDSGRRGCVRVKCCKCVNGSV